jgi:alpha-beta hydrolase superfamily lysophospholipase
MAPAIEEHRFTIAGAGGVPIAAYRWKASGQRPVRGVLQIAHGLGEHALRYPPALGQVFEAGYAVFANDHRGHGASVRDEAGLGSFGAGGFPALVDDMAHLTRTARSEYPAMPLILLGHSMGSFAAQLFMIEHADSVDGVALSGSAALDGLLKARALAPDPFAFYNASFEPARTAFDWLTQDEKIVDAYIADPRCGFQLDTPSRASLNRAAGRLADPEELRRIRPDLPVYLLAGDADPINLRLSLLHLLMARYRQAGMTRLDYDFYPGARHEVLNEVNRDVVVGRLLDWMNRIS